MKPNLLPCPFCGGAAERITLQDADNFGGDVITCSKCDCCTRVVFGEREGLLESWNTRAKSAPSPAGVDGLKVVGWYTEDHLYDKSATTYSWTVAERWVEKGWPVSPLYAAPVSEAKAQGVVMPERKEFPELMMADYHEVRGWNACLGEVARLNAASVQQPKCKTCNDNGRIGGPSFYAPDEGGEPCPDCSATVQQVSVPASAFASRAITHYEAALLAAFPSGSSGEVFNQWNEARRVLAAAPAAPVAVLPVERDALSELRAFRKRAGILLGKLSQIHARVHR